MNSFLWAENSALVKEGSDVYRYCACDVPDDDVEPILFLWGSPCLLSGSGVRRQMWVVCCTAKCTFQVWVLSAAVSAVPSKSYGRCIWPSPWTLVFM